MKLWISWDPFFIPSTLLALTKFTLTAVLTAQFTSPHHRTLAGEGKTPSIVHRPKWLERQSTQKLHHIIVYLCWYKTTKLQHKKATYWAVWRRITACNQCDSWWIWRCRTGSLPVPGIWQQFCWHLIFLTHTGQIRTLPYTRAPWIRSPRRCLQGDHRSCSLNEVMEDPVTKTQSRLYLLMCNPLMQAANLKCHKRVDVTKK